MWSRASYEMKTAVWTLVAVALANVLSLVVVVRSLRSVIYDQGRQTTDRASLLAEAERLRVSLEEEMRFARAYVYGEVRDAQQLRNALAAREESARHLAHLEEGGDEIGAILPAVRAELRDLRLGLDEALRDGLSTDATTHLFARRVTPHFEELQRLLGRFSLEQEKELLEGARVSRAAAREAMKTVIVAAISSGLFTGSLALFLLLSLRVVRDQREQLAQTVAELERSNKDLDAFAGRVAHDLRNVLAPASLALRRIAEVMPDRTAASPYLRVIERSGDRAKALIEALLDFARAGTQPPMGFCSVGQVVADAMEEVAAPAAAAQIELTHEIVDERLRCNAGMLHAVVSNLLSNAVKFTAGEPQRRVTVRGRPGDGRYVLEFEDTGPGIPAAARSRIFEPFFRVDDGRAEGFGIGLATVKRIIDAQGGWIEVLPAAPKGTLIRVHLPYDCGAQAESSQSARP